MSNCPRCQIVLLAWSVSNCPVCQIVRGVKLSHHRLTYNCAHLRLTKENQIVEIGEKEGKFLKKANIFVAKEKKNGGG